MYRICTELNDSELHHNLFITLLLGYKAETVLVKQPFYIQTKTYRIYRKMTVYGHFSIKPIHFWDSSLNCVISKTNSVIKRFVFNCLCKWNSILYINQQQVLIQNWIAVGIC